MEKDVKILLNGKTINAKVESTSDRCGAFTVYSGCSLTINGDGVVNGGSGCSKSVAVWMFDNSEVTINGGKFMVGRDNEGSSNSTIYINGNDAKLTINGGEFHAPQELGHHAGHYYLVNLWNSVTSADIKIKGGVFYGWDPATGDDEISVEDIPMLADGYESYIIDANGKDYEGRDCIIYGVRAKRD